MKWIVRGLVLCVVFYANAALASGTYFTYVPKDGGPKGTCPSGSSWDQSKHLCAVPQQCPDPNVVVDNACVPPPPDPEPEPGSAPESVEDLAAGIVFDGIITGLLGVAGSVISLIVLLKAVNFFLSFLNRSFRRDVDY